MPRIQAWGPCNRLFCIIKIYLFKRSNYVYVVTYYNDLEVCHSTKQHLLVRFILKSLWLILVVFSSMYMLYPNLLFAIVSGYQTFIFHYVSYSSSKRFLLYLINSTYISLVLLLRLLFLHISVTI